MIRLQTQELERDVNGFLRAEENFWPPRFRLRVEHAFLYGGVDFVQHLEMSPFSGVGYYTEQDEEDRN